MAAPAAPVVSISRETPRIRVFIDYWNLQLTLNEKEAKSAGADSNDVRFKVDWRRLPQWLANKAAETAGIPKFTFEGAIIYASYNPKTDEGRGFNKWATSWLNRQPGIQVQCRTRQPRTATRCTTCHAPILKCPRPECGAVIIGTVEKGVDTAIATDMIRLAWEDAYEVGVLASSDADLVPAVKFLDLKGRKLIQAGFPPTGVELATACWASFDLFPDRDEFRRK